jgi:dehydrodolichyl diphosphate syntase complex subunit NUS1
MLHLLLHFILSTVFGIYIRIRKLYHALFDRLSSVLNYHHRTPERTHDHEHLRDQLRIKPLTDLPVIARDVKSLARLPKHLSVVLSLPPDQKDVNLLLNRLDGLIHDACEIAAWTTAAGIPVLSIYERSGKSPSFLTQPPIHKNSHRTPPKPHSPLTYLLPQASSNPP